LKGIGGNKKLIDFACGKGSDIRRWVNNRVSFVLGIDYAGDNITNIEDGAYARLLTFKEKNKKKDIPPMVFVIGNTSKRLVDGRAGSTDEERDILRSVFGKYSPIGPIPPYIDNSVAGELKSGGDAVSCMFAVHYFFENKQVLDGFIHNIRESLKVGGYFFGCCFDGDSVFKLLRNIKNGGTLTGIEKDVLLWNIRKDYDADELVNGEDSLGMKININFISIGSPHDEYLVNFSYFVELMKESGLELLNDQELKEIGLNNSTNLFSESYEMSKKGGRNYVMSDCVKQFSFLNRWFIFKKRREIVEEDDEEYVPIVNNRKKKVEEKYDEEQKQELSKREEEIQEPTLINKALETEDIPKSINKPFEITGEQIAEKEESDLIPLTQVAAIERTIPVAPGIAQPAQKLYSANEVFNFYMEAPFDDKKLKIGDKGAARWLAPSSPFPIEDPDNKSILYPSTEHFMAAMMYKYGSDKPDLAVTLLSREGTIHQEFVRKRLIEVEGLKKPISEDRDFQLLKDEITDVKDAIRPASFKKYKTSFNESKYTLKKDELLRYAIDYRYKKDVRLRKIIEAARKENKYLLYFTRSTTGINLGGMRKTDGSIQGDNKLGKLYMELGGYI
jgi:hypothetical protein